MDKHLGLKIAVGVFLGLSAFAVACVVVVSVALARVEDSPKYAERIERTKLRCEAIEADIERMRREMQDMVHTVDIP
jgi:uncharacterized membrane protein YhiD involved in acid resistance